MIKAIILISLAVLWRLGGWDKMKWSGYRDVLIPIIIGCYIGFNYGCLVGLATIAAFQIIRLGYGAYDPEHDDKPSFLASITKDRDGWINRAIAGALYVLVGLMPLMVYFCFNDVINDLVAQKYLACVAINMAIGGILCGIKTKDIFIEPAIGAGVGLIVFFF